MYEIILILIISVYISHIGIKSDYTLQNKNTNLKFQNEQNNNNMQDSEVYTPNETIERPIDNLQPERTEDLSSLNKIKRKFGK